MWSRNNSYYNTSRAQVVGDHCSKSKLELHSLHLIWPLSPLPSFTFILLPHLQHRASLEGFDLDRRISLDGVPVPQHEPLSCPPRPNIPRRHGQAKTRSARYLIKTQRKGWHDRNFHLTCCQVRQPRICRLKWRDYSKGPMNEPCGFGIFAATSPLILSPTGSSHIIHRPAALQNVTVSQRTTPKYRSCQPPAQRKACRSLPAALSLWRRRAAASELGRRSFLTRTRQPSKRPPRLASLDRRGPRRKVPPLS